MPDNSKALGAAILRLSMGLLFLGHVTLRIGLITLPVAVDFFASLGLPGFMAYVVTAAEAVIGILLIIGWQVRLAALAGAVLLAGATILVHWPNGFLFTNPGGGWEYPVFWCIALIAQSLLGSGAWSRPEPTSTG